MAKVITLCITFVFITTTATVSSEHLLKQSMTFGFYHKLEKLLPGEKPPAESLQTLFTIENQGKLENGLANHNLLHSITLKEAFEKVHEMAGRPNCGLFNDVSKVVMRFCPVDKVDTTTAVGSFSSLIKLEEFTTAVNSTMRGVDYSLYLTVNATIHSTNAFERCQTDKSSINQLYNQVQTLHTSKHKRQGKKQPPTLIHELILPNIQYITVAILKQPRFFRIILATPGASTDQDYNKCHALHKIQEDEITIEPQHCSIGERHRTMIEHLNNKVSVKFEERKSDFSLLMYDSAASEQQLGDAEQMKGIGQDPRFVQVVGSSKANFPRKISVDQMSNGRVFSFEFGNSTSNGDSSSEQALVVYFDGMTSENRLASENGIKNLDDNKKVPVVQQPKKLHRAQKAIRSEQCILNWLVTRSTVDRFTPEFLTIPAVCDGKRMVCGYLSMKISEGKALTCSSLKKADPFELKIKTKTAINKDEKNGEPQTHVTYIQGSFPKRMFECIGEDAGVFKAAIKKLLSIVKASLSSFFRQNIWKDFLHSHEILTVRRAQVCNGSTCSTLIRIGLEYNVTLKPGVEPVFEVNPERFSNPHPVESLKLKIMKILTGQGYGKRLQVKQLQQPQQHMKTWTPWNALKTFATKIKKAKIPKAAKTSSLNLLKKIFFKPGTKKNETKMSDQLARSDKHYKAHNVKLTDTQPDAVTKTTWFKEFFSKGLNAFSTVRFVDERKMMEVEKKKLKSSGVATSLNAMMCLLLVIAKFWFN